MKTDGKAEVVPLVSALYGNAEQENVARTRNGALVARAVAFYQCAYDLFSSKKMKEDVVNTYTPKFRSVGVSTPAADRVKGEQSGVRADLLHC